MVLQTVSGFFIGPLYIYFYGIVYAVAALCLYWFLSKKKDAIGITQRAVDELIIAVLIGLIVGGRIFHFLINDPGVFIRDPLELFLIRNGGMSFFGALIGILCGVGIWYRIQLKLQGGNNIVANRLEMKRKMLMILDLGSLVVCIALIFGRIANFLNQELVGRIADPKLVPWCVNFATASGCRHPYQLYAAVSHLLLAVVLLVLYFRNARTGTIIYTFLFGYGVLRFVTDFWREDPIVALGLTAWQFFAIVLAIVGGYLLVRHLRQGNHSENESQTQANVQQVHKHHKRKD